MPFKDPDRRREYHRNYQRVRRAGTGESYHETVKPEDIESAQGMLRVLSKYIALVDAAKADVFVKARAIGFLVSIGLKAVDTAEIARRLQVVEERLKIGRGENGHQITT